MKSIHGFNLCVLCGLLAGCASSPPRTVSPDVVAISWVARDVFETVSLNGTSFHFGLQLREDPEHRLAVETLLARHAESSFWDYRKESGVGLLSIGSGTAWARGLEMARNDPDPRVRAALWERVVLALDLGFDPSDLPAHPKWHGVPVVVRPVSFDVDEVSRTLLDTLEKDGGGWEEKVTSLHPLLPYRSSVRVHRRTVRDVLAHALSRFNEPHPESLRIGLQQLSEHENPDVVRAAQHAKRRFP